MTGLIETYSHLLSPPAGYSHQRVLAESGSLDETLSVANHDVILRPRDHQPSAVLQGCEMYYLNVMARPRRKCRFVNHPDHGWIALCNAG